MQRKQLLGKTPLSSLAAKPPESKFNDFPSRKNFSLFRRCRPFPRKISLRQRKSSCEDCRSTLRLSDAHGAKPFSPRFSSVRAALICLFRNPIARCFIHDLQSFAVVNDMFYIIFSSSLACRHFPKRPEGNATS